MKNVLCITGMHRSGTSLVASWLERCGLPIHDGRLLGPGLGNPKGHFEDLDFSELQADAIQSQIIGSQGWKVFSGNGLCFQERHLRLAEKLVEERNRKYNRWGWKDPRTVLFLNQWKEIIPQLKVLLIWRPCEEVVQSLVARFRSVGRADINLRKFLAVSVADAVKLWISYNRIICRYKEKHDDDTVLLSLNDILCQPNGVIRLIKRKWGMGLSDEPISQVFDPLLLDRSSFSATQWTARIYGFLCGSFEVEKRLRRLSDTV